MNIIKRNDYEILQRLISLNQNQVKKTVSTFLKNNNYKVKETKDYVIAAGDIPIVLVAHLDTVFEKDRKFHKRDNLLYDMQKGIMWHQFGAGFDDRAGVFAILKILKDGYRPHVIFTTDEEIGGIGAVQLTEDYEEAPFEEVKYFIELDRANKSDCVFYDCDNHDFIKYVEKFGFIEAWGTFSDIDIICSEWGIAGVNLSVGYENEHTASEILNVNAMFKTIQKVKLMLEDAPYTKQYEYVLSPYALKKYYDYNYSYMDTMLHLCHKCKKEIFDYEGIPVKTLAGDTKFYCPDCIDDKIGWCFRCGEAFERDAANKINLCPDCLEVLNES